MGDMRNFNAESPRTVSIDPYALVSAIMGSQVERPREASTMSSTTDGLQADYDELVDMSNDNNDHRGPRPDSPPKDMCVGAANPYALVEAMLGRKIDKTGIDVARILSNVLQTDYDELFDMKHKSVLYAGMRLNEDKRRAERLSSKDIKILTESDLITPDFSQVQKLKDIEQVGLKDLGNARVKLCRMQNGKLRLVLHAHQIGRTVSNHELTRSLNDLTTPFRHGDNKWLPPNASWRDAYDYFFQTFNRRLINEISMFHIGRPDLMDITNLQQNQMLRRGIQYHRFDDPVQGCSTNSWLIAALFSVFWADPCMINRDTRLHSGSSNSGRSHGPCGVFSDDSDDNDGRRHQRRYLAIKFHSQGGDNDNKTRVVEVNYEIPMNNSNNQPIYCRSSDGADIWPPLYEKAFAKWITDTDSEHPDITKTHCGNPVKAMAQINGRTPKYWECDRHRGIDLFGLVRANSVNHKTINPMCAWTYATGQHFRGANIIANHAYSVLGYITQGENQYLVLRNPWGVTEPQGLTAYPGLISQVDPELWTPAALLDHGGLFALEAEAFKNCFQYIGVAR